ncbi:MAG TPA: SPOR domain-containing protein [Caulobacteraceae bacterium]|jgi:hypothetical protein
MLRPLLVGLLLATAPAAFAAASPAGGNAFGAPLVKDGVEITILPTVAPVSAVANGTQVDLDLEARDAAVAARLGFLSMRATALVDCRAGENRFLKADVYAQADLKGDAKPRAVSGDWVRPDPASYMFAVVARVCAAATPVAPTPRPPTATDLPPAAAAKHALPVVTLGEAPPPTAGQAATPPPPKPVKLAAGPPPKPTPPQNVVPKSPPSYIPAKAGRGVAQVAASPTAKAAQHVLDQLHGLIAPPLTASVEAAQVQNQHIFRASVSGFASLTDARAFCNRAASVSKTCWVHWKAN